MVVAFQVINLRMLREVASLVDTHLTEEAFLISTDPKEVAYPVRSRLLVGACLVSTNFKEVASQVDTH